MLFLGGSQDVIAGTLSVSIGHVTAFLQIATILVPPIMYFVAYHLCVALRRREGPERTERAGVVVRDAGGGYHGVGEAHDSDGDGRDARRRRT